MLRRFAMVLALSAVLTVPAQAAAADGELFVIHAVPGLPAPVDVLVDGDYQFSFDYLETAGPVTLPPGDYDLEVQLMGATVLAATATVEAGMAYTAIAHLTEAAAPALALFVDDLSAIRSGRARLTVRHTAAAPTVDVELYRGAPGEDGELIAAIAGVSNGDGFSAELKPGAYNASLLAGGAEVFNSGAFNLAPSQALFVYAVGVFPDSFELFVRPVALERARPMGGLVSVPAPR